MGAIWSLLRGLFSLASMLALAAGLLRLFYVDVLVVPHNGMAPTLTYGEHVLVWRRAQVDMGDIVVCEHPHKPEARVLARAVAFAGHTVGTDGVGYVLVDGERSSIDWEGELRFYDVTREKLFFMRVGSMAYQRQNRHAFVIERETDFSMRSYKVERGAFLLGDNRSDAIDDSREFGEVDPAKCHGQVFLRLWPAPAQDDDIHHAYLAVVR